MSGSTSSSSSSTAKRRCARSRSPRRCDNLSYGTRSRSPRGKSPPAAAAAKHGDSNAESIGTLLAISSGCVLDTSSLRVIVFRVLTDRQSKILSNRVKQCRVEFKRTQDALQASKAELARVKASEPHRAELLIAYKEKEILKRGRKNKIAKERSLKEKTDCIKRLEALVGELDGRGSIEHQLWRKEHVFQLGLFHRARDNFMDAQEHLAEAKAEQSRPAAPACATPQAIADFVQSFIEWKSKNKDEQDETDVPLTDNNAQDMLRKAFKAVGATLRPLKTRNDDDDDNEDTDDEDDDADGDEENDADDN